MILLSRMISLLLIVCLCFAPAAGVPSWNYAVHLAFQINPGRLLDLPPRSLLGCTKFFSVVVYLRAESGYRSFFEVAFRVYVPVR